MMTVAKEPGNRGSFISPEVFLLERFKLVSTNIPGGSVQDIVRRCKVFFLCDTHSNPDYWNMNARLVQALWIDDKSCLYVENLDDPKKYFRSDEILKSVKCWDLEQSQICSTKGYFDTCLEFINYSALIIHLYLESRDISFKEGKSRDQEIQKQLDILEGSGFFEPFKENLGCMDQSTMDALKKQALLVRKGEHSEKNLKGLVRMLALDWLALLGLSTKSFWEKIERSFFPRNENLSSCVIKAHSEGMQRIFLVGGEYHLRKNRDLPSFHSGVDHVQTSMDKEEIPYVVLKASKKQIPLSGDQLKQIGISTADCNTIDTTATLDEQDLLKELKKIIMDLEKYCIPSPEIFLSDIDGFLQDLSFLIYQIQLKCNL